MTYVWRAVLISMLTAGSALLGGPIAAQTPPPQAPAGQQPP